MTVLALLFYIVVDAIIWVIVVLCIVLVVLQALGILNGGPMVPRIGGG